MGRPRRNHRSTATAATIRAAPPTKATTTPVVNDDELRIYNEQIRYREAVEFLEQQRELLQLQRKQRHSKKTKKDSTTASESRDTVSHHPHTTTTTTLQLMTRGMLRTLQDIQTESCTCPLCHQIYVQPITLVTCTHTFCQSCIHAYTDHSWYCPIPSCKLPVSMKQQDRKFWNVNAVTQTVVTSWANICHTLRQADDHWWETQNRMTPPPPPASWTDENEILAATATITKRKSPVSVPATGTNHPGSSSRVTFNTTTTTHVPQPTKKFRPTLGQSESTSTTEEEEEEEEEVVVEEGEQCFATPMDDDDSVSLF